MSIVTITTTEDDIGQRLDKVLAKYLPDISRTRVQTLIKQGQVTVNQKLFNSVSEKLDEILIIEIAFPEAIESDAPRAENIPLDIIYEDADLIVINKQAGLVVHEGAGNFEGTLVNALLHHCGDTLSGIGGVKRPGIVHRLDKMTSGLMIVAKNDQAHNHLSEQLQNRSLTRIYHALVWGVPVPPKNKIETYLDRSSKNRQMMQVTRERGRLAITHYKVFERFSESLSLVECRLQTGRTHQIRVHMQYLGYPLVGDQTYGAQATKQQKYLKNLVADDSVKDDLINFERQVLHAKKIEFIHPKTEKTLSFEAPYPDDIKNLVNVLSS